jgi:hypothetical protein
MGLVDLKVKYIEIYNKLKIKNPNKREDLTIDKLIKDIDTTNPESLKSLYYLGKLNK